MPKRNAADKRPTWTRLVLDALAEADDFMTVYQLMDVVGSNTGQTTASLFHLRKCHAVDCIESGGRLYWFATPGEDDRTRTVDERTPEEPGTRRRRGQTRKKP